jgi:hypothetical protein
MSDTAAAPRKITLGWLIAWAWTVVAGIGGIAELAEGRSGLGFFTLLSAVAACPSIWAAIKKNANVEVSGWLRFAAVVVLLIAAGWSSKPREGEGRSLSSPNEATSVSAPQQTANVVPATLLDIEGEGTKTTQKFTTQGNDWDLAWTYDCSNFGERGNFIVGIKPGDGAMFSSNNGVNQLGPKGSDVEHYHSGGTYYLEVNSECRWHIVAKG